MKLRPAHVGQQRDLEHALDCLKSAREYAKSAGCPLLVRKVRSAIKSAGGAGRHMRRRMDGAVAEVSPSQAQALPLTL